MSLCILAGGKVMVMAITTFTLAWSHSVEKTRWEEDWRITPAGLELMAARIKGSGAGMEPPEGAVLKEGVWIYAPSLPPQPALLLARSGATGHGWDICAEEKCIEIGATQDAPVELRPCAPDTHSP